MWQSRAAQLAGDFGSHTLYQSFGGLEAVLLWGHGYKSMQTRSYGWPLAATLLMALCVEGLKRTTGLPPPDGEPTGFPSGHTTFVFALAWRLTQVFPRCVPFWCGVATSVSGVNQDGWVLAKRVHRDRGMILADVNIALARDKAWAPLSHILGDRRPKLYATLIAAKAQ